jgi:hypothetical protein
MDPATDLPLAPIDTGSSSVYGAGPIDLMPVDVYPIDTGVLPLPVISPGSDLSSMYPQTVGTEFVSNGDGTYINLQTGQSVPYQIAQQITAATTGAASSSAQTSSAPTASNLVDPTTGQSYSGTLSAAAQLLKASGQLVNSAGQLTAAGQALAKQGALIMVPSSGPNFSAAISSLTSWFTESTVISGVPNWGVLAGAAIGLSILGGVLNTRSKGRRRR